MKKINLEFMLVALTCFLVRTVYSSIQPSCNLITNPVAKETEHSVTTVTMTTTSDWLSTDLCVCRLSIPLKSTYVTFDLLTPSDQDSDDVICGPYLTVEPTSGAFYHVCPRSQGSLHGSTVSNQSNIAVSLWSRDPKKSLLGANITFRSYIPITLTCRKTDNSSSNLENADCPCEEGDSSSPRSTGQSDSSDLSTRLMRGFVVSFSFAFVCGLLLLCFFLNRRFHFIERLKQKLSPYDPAPVKSVTHRGSENSALDAAHSYEELPAAVNAQPSDDLTYEQIKQITKTCEVLSNAPEMERPSKHLNGSTRSGIYEEIPCAGKLSDASPAALGDTNSLCPYATYSEVRDLKARSHLVGRGALSAGDISRWNYYSPPAADHVSKRNVRMPLERSNEEPEVEVIYGTVNKSKVNSVNGIHTDSSLSKQDDPMSRLGQQGNDKFASVA